jgi:molybdopterin-guanine dinucleotide biosynthesis adapter protein
MKIFGLAGWSGSGKTTLMSKLLPELISRGLTVSTMKHAHHTFDLDTPGKDSYIHRDAGATEVMIGSATRWALMHEVRDEPEPDFDSLLNAMTPVDLLLIEGFKNHGHSKVEIHRAENDQRFLYVEEPDIVAIASDVPLDGVPLPVVDLNDAAAVADFILDFTGLNAAIRTTAKEAPKDGAA